MDRSWRRALPCLALVMTCCILPARRVESQATPATRGTAGDTLDVRDCVDLARRAAPEVRSLAGDRAAARLDSAAAALNARPSFSVFGGTLLAPQGFYDPDATNLGEYELKAGVAWPLRDGGSRRRERARTALAASSASLDAARGARDAGLRAAAVALDALRVRETTASLRQSLEWLDRLQVLVASGVRAGARERADADRVALERDAVLFDLGGLEQSRGELGRELANLVGRDPAGAIDLREPAAADETAPAAADSGALLARASSSLELRSARVAESQLGLALEEARRRQSVTVDLSADAGLWSVDLSRAVPPDFAAGHPGATFGDRLRRDLGASVALKFQRPLFDRAAGIAVAARENAANAAALRTAAARSERQRQSLDLLGRWRGAAYRLALADAASARAEDHLLHLRSLYAAGGTPLLEVLDARRQLDDARSRRAEARMQCRLAHWEQELQQ